MRDADGVAGEPGSTATGDVGYKIVLKNELQGGAKTLLAGKYKIDKFGYNPGNNPKHYRHFVYYVVEDSNLPMGWLFSDHRGDADRPGIVAMVWFKARPGSVVAYLFKDGQGFFGHVGHDAGLSNAALERAERQ